MPNPDDLQQLRDQIDACERDAEQLLGRLDDASLNWRARPDTWSVGQCLHHLVLINEFYLRGDLERLERARVSGAPAFAGLRPTIFGRWFVRMLEPPVRLRGKAFRQTIPASTFSRDTLLTDYRSSHDPYRVLLDAAADVDINRVIVPNPFFPRLRMRLSTVLLVVPAHDRRHLWQARQVLEEKQRVSSFQLPVQSA